MLKNIIHISTKKFDGEFVKRFAGKLVDTQKAVVNNT